MWTYGCLAITDRLKGLLDVVVSRTPHRVLPSFWSGSVNNVTNESPQEFIRKSSGRSLPYGFLILDKAAEMVILQYAPSQQLAYSIRGSNPDLCFLALWQVSAQMPNG
jgi:hypothetical protein